jgi:GT2 family glycosyltransferase
MVSDGCTIRVVVCDNSPHATDGFICERLKTEGYSITMEEPNLTTFQIREDFYISIYNSPDNLGFAGGNNACVKIAQAVYGESDYIWFLNNDTEVDRTCLSFMLSRFKQGDKKVGICGSTLIYYHHKPIVQVMGGSTYEPWSGTMREIGNGNKWPCDVSESAIEKQMAYVCGASMLVSRSFLREVGLMNEDYFLFFEEIDWCERGRRKGYTFAYASKAIVYHKEGAAIGTGTGARRSLLAEYYGMRNKLLVTWRFFPWAFPSVWLIGWLQVARRALQRRPANAWIMAKVLCGLGKRPV